MPAAVTYEDNMETIMRQMYVCLPSYSWEVKVHSGLITHPLHITWCTGRLKVRVCSTLGWADNLEQEI